MRTYRCEYCGNAFDPVKSGVCPSCGAAVSPAVMTEIERDQAAARSRAERMKEEIVRRHETQAQPGPTRLSSARTSAPRPSEGGSAPRRTRPEGTGFLAKSFIAAAVSFIVVTVLIVFGSFVSLRSRIDRWNGEPTRELPVQLPEGDIVINLPEDPVPTWTEQLGGLGDTLSTESYAVTAVALRDYDIKGYETMNLPEDTHIVAVEFRVENLSQEVYQVEEVWGWAEDREGYYLDAEEHAPNDEERANRLFTGQLYPGHETTGRVFLEVPDEAVSLTLYYGYDDVKFQIELP